MVCCNSKPRRNVFVWQKLFPGMCSLYRCCSWRPASSLNPITLFFFFEAKANQYLQDSQYIYATLISFPFLYGSILMEKYSISFIAPEGSCVVRVVENYFIWCLKWGDDLPQLTGAIKILHAWCNIFAAFHLHVEG